MHELSHGPGANRIDRIGGIMYVPNKIATLTVILVILVGCAQQPNMPRSSEAYDLSGSVLAEKLKKM